MLYYTDELLKNMDGKKISIIVLLDMFRGSLVLKFSFWSCWFGGMILA